MNLKQILIAAMLIPLACAQAPNERISYRVEFYKNNQISNERLISVEEAEAQNLSQKTRVEIRQYLEEEGDSVKIIRSTTNNSHTTDEDYWSFYK